MHLGTFLALIATVLIVPVISVIIFFKNLKIFYRRKEIAIDSELKPLLVSSYSPEIVGQYRSVFFLLGICIAMGILLLSFNFSPVYKPIIVDHEAHVEDEIIEIIPNTNLSKPLVEMPKTHEVIEVKKEIEGEEIEVEPDIVLQKLDVEVNPKLIPTPIVIDIPDVDPEEEDTFIVVEHMPKFPGGETAMYKFLFKHIKYPTLAKANGIEGKVHVQFVINKLGEVTDYKILRGVGGGCDEEAIKAVRKMPNWEPGKQRGKNVNVQYTIPVFFTLD